jgi:pilus assembly protein CpaB
VTKSRIRNLVLPLGLAALAAVLVGIYVVSYRNSVTEGAALEKVLVAARDIPAGTEGAAVASGGYLKTQTVPARAVVPGSVTTAAPLTSLVAADPIYEGQQITLRQFKPAAKGGIFAKFAGNQRAVGILGEPYQLLVGTISSGDRVDVVATARYRTGNAQVGDRRRATTRVVLRDLLVLKAPDAEAVKDAAAGQKFPMTLVLSDSQAQTMGWAMRNATWFLALRPTKDSTDSPTSLETLHSFLARGLPPRTAQDQITGDFPETIDE